MSDPDPKATQEHWDQLAPGYDEAKRRNDAYYSTLKACVHAALPQSARGRVLDIGCGTGQVLASLRPLNGVGIDVSHAMIEIAAKQFADRRELTFAPLDAGGAAGLGEFDSVISIDVMEHVQDWRGVIRTMVNACRRSGLIVVTTPNPTWTFPLWMLEKLRLKMPEGPHRFVRAGLIAGWFDELNCEVQQVSTHLAVPIQLFGIGPGFSRWLEPAPIFRSLGVIQLVIAKRR